MQNPFTEFYLNKVLVSILFLLVGFLISLFLKRSIDLIFIQVKRRVAKREIIAKTRTIRSLFKNIIDTVVFLITILIILSNWSINILPILAGAGILGLAISFGAQSLVKDLISGFFIILENQFNIGNEIKIGNFEGRVINITLRTTTLVDQKENTIIIPNSQITTVVRIKEEEV